MNRRRVGFLQGSASRLLVSRRGSSTRGVPLWFRSLAFREEDGHTCPGVGQGGDAGPRRGVNATGSAPLVLDRVPTLVRDSAPGKTLQLWSPRCVGRVKQGDPRCLMHSDPCVLQVDPSVNGQRRRCASCVLCPLHWSLDSFLWRYALVVVVLDLQVSGICIVEQAHHGKLPASFQCVVQAIVLSTEWEDYPVVR